ncbi:MAG: site-specific integrase, partial [Christensenellales bacterium]
RLYIAMNLAFACSLRVGEILGLTWDNVHIEKRDIARDDAHVCVEKELQRASVKAIEVLDQKDIIRVFPAVQRNPKTRLVLKTPKTRSSVRKVWLPKTAAYILREYRGNQKVLKDLLQDEYEDYNLVVALANGRPCEERLIAESFQRLREKVGLPNVVFHSLRHSSTTYKLKLNKGDLKATQGDTGHAEIDMITKVYAHILDEDRKLNAQRFEAAFYANPDLRNVKPPEPKNTIDLADLIEQLKTSPELAGTLAKLVKS